MGAEAAEAAPAGGEERGGAAAAKAAKAAAEAATGGQELSRILHLYNKTLENASQTNKQTKQGNDQKQKTKLES